MSDSHVIRLDAGWEWTAKDVGRPHVSPRRIHLPCTVQELGDQPGLLRRHFGRPIHPDPDSSLILQLQEISGLVRVSLNQLPIAVIAPDEAAIDLPISGKLERRNLLEFEVDPGLVPPGRPWGIVRLVFSRS